MSKRNVFYLFLFLLISVIAFCLLYFFQEEIILNVFGFGKEPSKEKINIHLYGNDQVNLNKILIRVYYCVAKDSQDLIINQWQEALGKDFTKVKDFYEFQFAHHLQMGFEIYPEIIYSEHDSSYFAHLIIEDYKKELVSPHSQSLVSEQVINEVKNETKNKEKLDFLFETSDDSYVINFFVLGFDNSFLEAQGIGVLGLNDEANNSLVFSFIFTETEFEDFRESVIGHEIGHALGIPEFYDYSSNEIKSRGIMGEGFIKKIEYNFLNHEIKNQMGWY